MEEKPGFSFIIPAREEGEYIGRSLGSLVAGRDAAGFAVEIVVVDGKSTDATVQVASKLADSVITDSPLAWESIAHARNVGAAASTGRFLFHTDADVVIPELPRLLERAAREFIDPAVVAVTVPVMPYPWDSGWGDRFIHRLANAHFRLSFRYGAFFARGECQIVRRESFEAVGGYRGDLISGEDCDLFRRLSRVGRIVYMPDLCVYHSLRRFRGLGYLRVLGFYLREWIWMSAFDRSFIREWPVVR
jgi:glycosyltransferase involved in cell wall biosynthesis